MSSLWGEDFEIKETPKQVKKILNKIKNPKSELSIQRSIVSKSLSLAEKLPLIKQEVYRILGSYASETIVIRTEADLIKYIDEAIKNGVIAVDTETNNSLDPITCKLMGACIYTPGQKQAYIPINHVNTDTYEKLKDQVSEEIINYQFSRLKDTKIIMHNGKFDREVIYCTCGLFLDIYWDTLIGAKILDENERSAGLKNQYITKIDPSIEKYSIEGLFENIPYEYVDPELFALYAATDAYMTYKLYLWQKEVFERPENSKLYNLFMTVEMPIVPISAQMELNGCDIDVDYAHVLSKKYHNKLEACEAHINYELNKLKPLIDEWRKSPEANQISNKVKTDGSETATKSKNEQLKDPIQVTSNVQLAILLYDILKAPIIDKKSPRGTGEEIISQLDFPICKLILKYRGILKLLNTYIDKLPESINPKSHRLQAQFKQCGTATGRFSSSDPNLQNIPSHNKEIRMIFKASCPEHITMTDDEKREILLPITDDINTASGWVRALDLKEGSKILIQDVESLKEIEIDVKNIFIQDKNTLRINW